MLSRVADALYWMARYVERAEHAARLLEVTRRVLIDLEEVDPERAEQQRQCAARILRVDSKTTIEALVLDPSIAGSVAASLSRARENGRQVREVISSEMWDYLNQAHWALEEASRGRKQLELLPQTIGTVLEASFLFAGVTDATMDRGPGWLFIRLGQFVERLDRTSNVFSEHWSTFTQPEWAPQLGSGRPPSETTTTPDNVQWITLLRACGCLEAYRKRYPTRLDPRDVVNFILLEPNFPRTVRYSASVTRDLTRRLAESAPSRGAQPVRAFGKLASAVEFVDVDEVLALRPGVFIENLLQSLNAATLRLQTAYFLH